MNHYLKKGDLDIVNFI